MRSRFFRRQVRRPSWSPPIVASSPPPARFWTSVVGDRWSWHRRRCWVGIVASSPGIVTLPLRTDTGRPPINASSETSSSLAARQPEVGLPAHPRRTPLGSRGAGLQRPPSATCCADTAWDPHRARGAHLAGVPMQPSRTCWRLTSSNVETIFLGRLDVLFFIELDTVASTRRRHDSPRPAPGSPNKPATSLWCSASVSRAAGS